jgi:hypothetical protein
MKRISLSKDLNTLNPGECGDSNTYSPRWRLMTPMSQLSLKQDILERSDKKNSTLYDENRELKEIKKILELEKEELMARLIRIYVIN